MTPDRLPEDVECEIERILDNSSLASAQRIVFGARLRRAIAAGMLEAKANGLIGGYISGSSGAGMQEAINDLRARAKAIREGR